MIKTDIKLAPGYTPSDIKEKLCEHLYLSKDELSDFQIIRRSLNVKDKSDIHYDLRIAIDLPAERERSLLNMRKKVSSHTPLEFTVPPSRLEDRPIVVGAGPSGLFAALILAESGARPILIERGLPIEDRGPRVELFKALGILDPESNVQFGEGGAGAYSDGKLKSGSPDKYKMKVLSELILHGAPEDIIYTVGAHVGTDRLGGIVKSIREKIISLGGEVFFSSRLSDIIIKNDAVVGIRVEKSGEILEFQTRHLIVGAGHSAKDVFEIFKRCGARLEARGFGIGMRIEHPREYINELVYGKNHPDELGAASYHLVTHLKNGRSVYSFCMCPGGTVVAASSERGGIVTNGMSEYSRSADNSNAAFLVSVAPSDFPSDDALAGLDLQRSIERRAFALTSGTYKAPSIRMESFAIGGSPEARSVRPSYPLGTEPHHPNEFLPDYITDSLKESIREFDSWMPGFYLPDAVMTGPETRSTSPVRVLRNDSFEAIGIEGLYPIGEGAGYSGGIVSSARDGVMAAEAILKRASRD